MGMNVEKQDGGMWISSEAWRILSERMVLAQYRHRDGGIRIPPTDDELALLKVMDMAKEDGLQFVELT